MKPIDYILLVIVAAIIGAAVYFYRKNLKKGGCGCGCSGTSCENCQRRVTAEDDAREV